MLKLVITLILIILDKCWSESVVDQYSRYNNSLFPPPKYKFIEDKESFQRYEMCLTTTKAKFDCKQCINTDRVPTTVNSTTFCCFYYEQIDCTFRLLLSELESHLAITLSPNRSEISELELDSNRTLVKLSANEQCVEIDLEHQCQTLKSTTEISESTEDPSTAQTEAKHSDDISVTQLLAIGAGSLLVASLLFVGLVYLTNKEKQHFLALRASSHTTEFNSSN